MATQLLKERISLFTENISTEVVQFSLPKETENNGRSSTGSDLLPLLKTMIVRIGTIAKQIAAF